MHSNYKNIYLFYIYLIHQVCPVEFNAIIHKNIYTFTTRFNSLYNLHTTIF